MKKLVLLVALTVFATTMINAQNFVADINANWAKCKTITVTVLGQGLPAIISFKKEFAKEFTIDATAMHIVTNDEKKIVDFTLASEAITAVSISSKVDKKTNEEVATIAVFVQKSKYLPKFADIINKEYKNCTTITFPGTSGLPFPTKVDKITEGSLKITGDMMTFNTTAGADIYTSLAGMSYIVKTTTLANPKKAGDVDKSVLVLIGGGIPSSKSLGDVVASKIKNKDTAMVAFLGATVAPFMVGDVDQVANVNNTLYVKYVKGTDYFIQYQNLDAVRLIVADKTKMAISY